MKIEIHDLRSISKAMITVSSIALITGKNTSGKSTIINGIAHTLLGHRKLYGVTEKKVEAVVREGADIASVEVTGADWERTSTWPGDCFESGTSPPATVVTMGLEDPAGNYSSKDWSQFIRRLAPSENKVGWKEFLIALEAKGGRDEGDEDEALQNVIRDQLKKSWDAAAVVAKERALKAKQAWAAVTGEAFGSEKSNMWEDPDWVETTLPEDYDDAIEALKSEHARSVAQQEVTGGQLEDLEAAYEYFAQQQNETKSKIEICRIDQKNNEDALAKYPMSRVYTCPCCQEKLEVSGTELIKYKVRQFERGSADHQKLEAEKERLESWYSELAEKNGSLIARMQADKAMINKLKIHDESLRDPDTIKTELDENIKRQTAANRTVQAQACYNEWKWFNTAESLLAPSGLRFEATKKAVKGLAPRVTELAAYIFPEHHVVLDASEDGVKFLFDGRDYKTMAWNGDPNSYRLGIQILVQCLQAEQLGDKAPILIDRFDTLDIRRQNGVLTLFKDTGRPVIVAKTMAEKQPTDKLLEHGIGKTYWINDGTLEAV